MQLFFLNENFISHNYNNENDNNNPFKARYKIWHKYIHIFGHNCLYFVVVENILSRMKIPFSTQFLKDTKIHSAICISICHNLYLYLSQFVFVKICICILWQWKYSLIYLTTFFTQFLTCKNAFGNKFKSVAPFLNNTLQGHLGGPPH